MLTTKIENGILPCAHQSMWGGGSGKASDNMTQINIALWRGQWTKFFFSVHGTDKKKARIHKRLKNQLSHNNRSTRLFAPIAVLKEKMAKTCRQLIATILSKLSSVDSKDKTRKNLKIFGNNKIENPRCILILLKHLQG